MTSTSASQLLGDQLIATAVNTVGLNVTQNSLGNSTTAFNDVGNQSSGFYSTQDPNGTTIFQEQPLVNRLAAYSVPVFFSIIFCVGIVGNSLVITVIAVKIYGQCGQVLNNTYRFILNLAISDMLFLIFCVPFHATIYTLPEWVFGAFMCPFTRVCEELTKIASVYTLVALSVDRFLAVVYATSSRQFRTRTHGILGQIFIWVSAVGMALPAIATRYQYHFHGIKFCITSKLTWKKWYELTLFLFGYVFPLLIILVCYIGLLYAMCRSARRSSISKSTNSNNSYKKVTRIVIMVVVLFALCWLPHHIANLWMLFGKFESNNVNVYTFVFRICSHCMAYANSCINPLVYAFVSKKFRQDFKNAFTCHYFSDSVGSVKEFSQRMLVSIGGTVRLLGQRRYSHSQDVSKESRDNSFKLRTPPSEAKQKTRFSPRSPLMSYARIDVFEVSEEHSNKELDNSDAKTSSDKISGTSSSPSPTTLKQGVSSTALRMEKNDRVLEEETQILCEA